MRLWNWASSWIETWRIAPPLSARRRRLLEAIREAELADPDDWVEVAPPGVVADVNRPRLVGDGITDDTEAMQYALDHNLPIPHGKVYKISEPIRYSGAINFEDPA